MSRTIQYSRNKSKKRTSKNKFEWTPQEQEEDDRFYVVEKLLDKRIGPNGLKEYLVKWQNYPSEYDSWEPESELQINCKVMLDDFNKVLNVESEEVHCICKRTYRFDQGGMIQCFLCLTWYHFNCLGINMEEANSFARYHCPSCIEKNPNLKNPIKPDKLTRGFLSYLVNE